jgi:hypothetical protein
MSNEPKRPKMTNRCHIHQATIANSALLAFLEFIINPLYIVSRYGTHIINMKCVVLFSTEERKLTAKFVLSSTPQQDATLVLQYACCCWDADVEA